MPSSNEIKKQNQLLGKQQDILQSIQNTISGATATANNLSRAMGKAVSYASQLGGDMGETARNTNEAADHAQELGSNLKNAADSGISAMRRFGSSMGSTMQNVAETSFQNVTQTMGAIGEITQSIFSLKFLAGFSLLFGQVLSNWEKTTAELRTALGTVFTDTENDVNAMFATMERGALMSGLSLTEIANTAQSFSSEFGIGVSQSAQLAFNIEDGAKALSVSSGIMSNIVGGFSVAYDISTDQAHVLSEQVGYLAAQNDVAPRQVLQDIAESTEDMARFSAGGVKNFIKTAIQARKLGMSIKDVANTMNGLLNFEDSLNKELQASVMLGRRINLNEARRAAFAGDTAGAMEAVAAQLEGVDLEGLSPLQLQAVAEAANMSVSQIKKLTRGASQLGNIGTDSMDSFDTSTLNARDAMTESNKLVAESNAAWRELARSEGGKYFKSIEMTFRKVMDSGFFQSATKFLGDFNTGVQSFFSTIMDPKLQTDVGGALFAWAEGGEKYEKEVDGVMKTFTYAEGEAMTKGAGLLDIVKKLGKQFLTTILSFFGIETKVDTVIDDIKNYFTDLPLEADLNGDKTVGVFEGVFYKLKGLFKKLGESLGLTGEGGLFTNLFGEEGGLMKKIKAILKSIGDAIGKAFNNLLKPKEGGEAGGKKGEGILGGFIDGMLGDNPLGGLIDKLFSEENIAKIQEKLGTISFKTFNLQAILNSAVESINFGELTTTLKNVQKKAGEKAATGYNFFKSLFGLDDPKMAEDIAEQVKTGIESLAGDPEFEKNIQKLKTSTGLGDIADAGTSIAETFKNIADPEGEFLKRLTTFINDLNGTIEDTFDRLTTISATTKFKLGKGFTTSISVGDSPAKAGGNETTPTENENTNTSQLMTPSLDITDTTLHAKVDNTNKLLQNIIDNGIAVRSA